jgi:hypothetical protein
MPVKIRPPKLAFTRPTDRERVATLELTNDGNSVVAFSIEGYGAAASWCEPGSGFIQPNSTVEVKVHLLAMGSESPLERECIDCYLILTVELEYLTPVVAGKPAPIRWRIWNTPTCYIQDNKFPVTYFAPGATTGASSRSDGYTAQSRSTQVDLPAPTKEIAPARIPGPAAEPEGVEAPLAQAYGIRQFLIDEKRDINQQTRQNEFALEETRKKVKELEDKSIILDGARKLWQMFANEFEAQEVEAGRQGALDDLLVAANRESDGAEQDDQHVHIKVEEGEDIVAVQDHRNEDNDTAPQNHNSSDEPPAKSVKSAHVPSTELTSQTPAQPTPLPRPSHPDDATTKLLAALQEEVNIHRANQVERIIKHCFLALPNIEDKEDFLRELRHLVAKGLTYERFDEDIRILDNFLQRDQCFTRAFGDGVVQHRHRILRGSNCSYCKENNQRNCYTVRLIDDGRDPGYNNLDRLAKEQLTRSNDLYASQMLSARAETDPHLKELRQAVFWGEANAEQLKEHSKLIEKEIKARADAVRKGTQIRWIVKISEKSSPAGATG